MTGLSTPPQFQTYSAQTASTGKAFAINSFVGAAVGAGQMVAVDTFTNSQVVQWPSVYNLSTFRTIALPDTQPRSNSICYDALNECFYIGVYITSISGPHKAVTVYKLTLDGTITRLANATDTGSNPSTTIAWSQICTDGSFIYLVLAAASGNSSNVVKLSCVDGSLVGSMLSLGTTPLPQASEKGHLIALANSTSLVIAGFPVSQPPWFASTTTSLGAPTLVDGNLAGDVSNQCVAVGGSIFTGIISGATGSLVKISADVGTITTYTYPGGGALNGICYDGTTIWAAGDNRTLVGFNSSGTVTFGPRDITVLPSPIMFLGAVTGGIVAIDSASNAGFFPTPSVTTLPPVIGHGSC